MFRWLSNAFRWLVDVFNPVQDPTTRQQREQLEHSTPNRQRGQYVESQDHVDLFDIQWREEAQREDQLMRECYENATNEREQGDHGTAQKYVNEAKTHQKKRDAANEKAVEWVLKNNSTDDSNCILDLHGLKVDEALDVVKKALNGALDKNCVEYQIITGRGKHSTNHQPKIKPRVLKYLEDKKYKYAIDEDNPGSLTVYLR